MTTPAPALDIIPTTQVPDLDEILALIPTFSGSQQAYLVALTRTTQVGLAAAEAGVSQDTICSWRSPSRDGETFRRVEQAIRQQRSTLSVAMARQHLAHHAMASAGRLADTAIREPQTVRERAVGLQAQTTLLEAVGVIQRQPATVVQVAQVASDPQTVRALLAEIDASRQALAAERQALQAALPSPLDVRAREGEASP